MRAAALALALALPVASVAGAADTTFLIVRHAEKVDGSANPDLSARGARRAAALAELAATWGVNAVVTTDFCRTAQTGAPVAAARRMPLVVQEISGGRGGIESCDPPIDLPVLYLDAAIDSSEALAAWALEDQRGRVVLIVGHSNTVPELVAAIGGDAVPGITMTEEEYDRLFVLTVPEDGSPAQLLEEVYGAD